MLPGTPVSASIQRGSTVLSPGQTSAYTTVLTLTLREPIKDLLFQPATAKEAADVFGVQIEHGATVYADWPASVTIPNPVKSGDMLKLADGTEYRVVDAHGFVGRYLSLMVELPD